MQIQRSSWIAIQRAGFRSSFAGKLDGIYIKVRGNLNAWTQGGPGESREGLKNGQPPCTPERAVVATLLHGRRDVLAGYPSSARAPSRSSAYPWRPRAPSCAARRVRSKQAPPAWPRTRMPAGCPRRPVPTRSSSAASSTTRAWRTTSARQALRTARVRRSASSCTAALARRRVGSLRADIRGDFAVASTHVARTGATTRAGRAA